MDNSKQLNAKDSQNQDSRCSTPISPSKKLLKQAARNKMADLNIESVSRFKSIFISNDLSIKILSFGIIKIHIFRIIILHNNLTESRRTFAQSIS